MEQAWFKRGSRVVLLVILGIGFLLRIYNLDFPSIGYHNTKENEYLSMAQEMARAKDLSLKKIYFYNAFGEGTGIGIHQELPLVMYQIPTVSYQILLSWKLFGENLWGARLVNVLFGVAGILVMYYIGLLLFSQTVGAVFCALLLAIMPLAIFFSRNLQPESPAFFFMLLGSLFYLRALKAPKVPMVFLGSVAFMIAGFYKMSFMFGALPFLFCVPFKELVKERSAFLKREVAFCVPYAAFFLVIWSMRAREWKFNEITRIKMFEIFTGEYFARYGKAIWWYAQGENFTLFFIVLAALGVIIALVRRRSVLDRYLIGWVFTAVIYGMVFSDFINQHNYYQMPFLAVVCLAISLTVVSAGEILQRLVKKNVVVYLMCIVTAVAIPSIKGSTLRMFGTVFLGEDVAGESLRELTSPDERIFLLTSTQGYAIARYARRPVGWVSGFDEFKEKEKKFNIRYLCFYPADFAHEIKRKDPAFFEYIQNNYHLKEAGLSDEPRQVYYVILEKGKGSDPKTFLTSFSGAIQLRTIYKLFDRYVFCYSLRPPEEGAVPPAATQ